MANDSVTTASEKNHHTICLPFCDQEYGNIIDDAGQFRNFLDCSYEKMPELFPPNFSQGYQLKDSRMSMKLNIKIRRIELRDDSSYSIRPSFVMPYMTAYTKDVEDPLFFAKVRCSFFGFGTCVWQKSNVLVSPGGWTWSQ